MSATKGVPESDRLRDWALERRLLGLLMRRPDLIDDVGADAFDFVGHQRIRAAMRGIPPVVLFSDPVKSIVEAMEAGGTLLGYQDAVVAVVDANALDPIDFSAAVERLRELGRARAAYRELLQTEGAWSEPDPDARTRPTVVVRDELNAVAAEAEAALLSDPDAGVYVRSRRLVRVVPDEGTAHGGLERPNGSPVIEPLTLDALTARLDRAARWVRRHARGHVERDARPPEWAARAVAAADAWGFPILTGVVEAPILKPDGSVLDRPGYDATTGLLYMPSGDFLPVPSRPTAKQVQAAVDLLREPFGDFPFTEVSGSAAAVATALSIVARHAIGGCVPMFASRATAPGTGKGMGCDVVSLIGTGRPAARMTMPAEDDELRKVILAVAFEGTPVVLLDNVDRALGSTALAAALTAADWTGRLLGSTAILRAPLRAVWLATGNGLTFRGDLGRRVVPIDLDARVEHPEDRTDFRHPDLLDWVREHRADLVAAALTVLRAFLVAGRPAHGCGPRMGSFEAWDDLVRGACVWAELGDPLGGRDRIRREDDGDLLALRAALAGWHEAFGGAAKTAAEAVAKAGTGKRDDPGDPTLRASLLGLTNHDKLDARSLGYALRRVRDRICGGLRFEADRDQQNTTKWKVSEVGRT